MTDSIHPALLVFVGLWFVLAILLFVLIPFELGLRGRRSNIVPWLGVLIRRSFLELDYDQVQRKLSISNPLQACELDKDRTIASLKMVRVTISRARGGTELVFRFPATLVAFFTLWIVACVTVTTQFAPKNLIEWSGVCFLVLFMCGLPLVIWRILHSVAVANSSEVIAIISGVHSPE